MNETLERWSSRRAFILAVTGAAVGLGNIWRFPYITGENGGAVFLLLYVAFVLLLGIPVMMAEILIGRAGRRSPMASLGYLAGEAGRSTRWRWLGLFGAFTVFCILSLYSVVSGWSIEFLVSSINGDFVGKSAAQVGAGFDAFLANPGLMFVTLPVALANLPFGALWLSLFFLPVGGLLIAVFAAWVMPAPMAHQALGGGCAGFRLWRLVLRWVSIPLTLIVLASGLF